DPRRPRLIYWRRTARTAAPSRFERVAHVTTSALAQRTPQRTNGIASPPSPAIAPPPAGPTTAPIAPAAFITPNPRPCPRPLSAAPSAISAIAGVKSAPYARLARRTGGTYTSGRL